MLKPKKANPQLTGLYVIRDIDVNSQVIVNNQANILLTQNSKNVNTDKNNGVKGKVK